MQSLLHSSFILPENNELIDNGLYFSFCQFRVRQNKFTSQKLNFAQTNVFHWLEQIQLWLLVGWGYNNISIHAVFLQSKVVLASTSSFVSACHNPEPALLTLEREKSQGHLDYK